jgi:N-acetyl-anhydromuramyl-L-alanine amidase AmpD
MRFTISDDGWISGAEIVPSPRHAGLLTPRPLVVVHHATATKASPAALTRKIRTYRPHLKTCDLKSCKEHDRAASWHLLGGRDGKLWQSVQLTRAAWHCAAPVQAAGIRWNSANRVSVSVEWENVGPTGKTWPAYTDQQRQLWRDLRQALRVWAGPMADWGHYELDPRRKSDPGRDWMNWVRSL